MIAYIMANLKNDYDYVSIAYGGFDWMIILMRLLGKRCVRVWTGSDCLKCKLFWDYKLRAKILNFFSDNITDAIWLTEELNECGIKSKTMEIGKVD